MAIINHDRFPVKPTRHAPCPAAPFGAGLDVERPHLRPCNCNACLDAAAAARKAEALRLSDAEKLILDERAGDWPPADADLDAESDPVAWQDWTDAFRFVPSADDEAWASYELNRAAADFDVVSGSMVPPAIALGLATGAIDLF